MKAIKSIGIVEKCEQVSVVTKGANPKFYEFGLLKLPLNYKEVYIKFQDHWFQIQPNICYDANGLPVLAIEKQEAKDQEFGITTADE